MRNKAIENKISNLRVKISFSSTHYIIISTNICPADISGSILPTKTKGKVIESTWSSSPVGSAADYTGCSIDWWKYEE